jgi:hypothetical protein
MGFQIVHCTDLQKLESILQRFRPSPGCGHHRKCLVNYERRRFLTRRKLLECLQEFRNDAFRRQGDEVAVTMCSSCSR